jgi:enoyl-CoA hydratase
MSETVLTQIEGRAGVITLNRPEAINALTPEMIAKISETLDDYLANDAVTLILFEGKGERGFCAGGDVKAARQAVLDGHPEIANDFFADEYAMNLKIATADKPIVALTDGVVMGGGIGLAGHAGYRITTERGRFAMPESAIGLHCDVGANALLAQTQRHRALAFLMSGEIVGAADALALGLTDCVIADNEIFDMREDILVAADGQDVPTAITNCLQARGISPGPAPFVEMVDGIADAFRADSAVEVLARLDALDAPGKQVGDLIDLIKQRCPTSLAVIYESLMAARRELSITTILERDLRLSAWMAQRPDFAEGVRAVIVDKDRNPSWQPDRLDKVDMEPIRGLIKS